MIVRTKNNESLTIVFCHCKGNTGEGQEATSCSDCTNICGAGNVQNCNYVVG